MDDQDYLEGKELEQYLNNEYLEGEEKEYSAELKPEDGQNSFKNESDQPAKMLISVAPAGLEQMFLEVGQPLDDAEMAPPPSHADIEKLLEAAPRYGVEIKLPHK